MTAKQRRPFNSALCSIQWNLTCFHSYYDQGVRLLDEELLSKLSDVFLQAIDPEWLKSSNRVGLDLNKFRSNYVEADPIFPTIFPIFLRVKLFIIYAIANIHPGILASFFVHAYADKLIIHMRYTHCFR